jgi:hypothetical protein
VALFFHEEQVVQEKRDDLYAYHYVGNWAKARPAWSPALDNLKKTVDKMVVHLTTQRVDGARRDVGRWAFELGQHIEKFEGVVSATLFPAKRKAPIPKFVVSGHAVSTTNS